MNEIFRPPFSVGQRDGDWVWDGCRWVCCPNDDCGQFPPFGPPVFSGPVSQPPWYPGANGGVSFGQEFPANPVRGHFFWNGTTLFLFDGAVWNPIGGSGSGGVITPPGSTFPPNPVPGQQFFDGTVLWIWSGSAWVAVGPGSGSGISNPNIYSVTTFNAPGNFSFTIPQDVVAVTVFKFHIQGGGGGGGGAATSTPYSAQGGGGGEYKQFSLIGAAKGLTVSCTVPQGGIGGAATGAPGQNGQDAQVVIANTNTTIVAKGGYGGWGNQTSGTNNNTEGTGGRNGTFSAGSSQVQLVLDIPGGDAHLPSPADWGNPGGGSFMGNPQPGFDDSVGWNDTTLGRGYGSGGRGAFNGGDSGGNGTQGVMIIERING